MKLKNTTRRQYIKLLAQLKRWSIEVYGINSLTDLTQEIINEYEQFLIIEKRLTIFSVNNHRQAINKFYRNHNIEIRLSLQSGRIIHPEILTISQVEDIIDFVSDYYKNPIKDIYHNHTKPQLACNKTLTPYGSMRMQTLNNKISVAVTALGYNKRCRAMMIHQSGIVHALQEGKNWRKVMEQAGLSEITMKKKYIPLARKQE